MTGTRGTEVLDLKLSSHVFDRSHPALIRDRIGLWEDRHAQYDDRYDFDTFIYDCFLDGTSGEIVLICPSLLNFNRLIPGLTVSVDRTPTRILGVETLSRGNVVLLECPEQSPEMLEISHPLFSAQVPINRDLSDAFAGTNAIYAISKDNRLDWIADWLEYYVAEHGANAIVLYDNGSTAYTMDELKSTMSGVSGIEVSALVRAPFPFGPGGAGNTNFNSKFLHMTMVELGRRRLLRSARAVLNVDIDEFAYSHTRRSVFDATVDSERGYIRMDGKWVYADRPDNNRLIRHRDHRLARKDGLPRVNRKWCVAPNGPLAGKPWLTHRIQSRKDPCDPDFGFWHFRQVSNNWDYDRDNFDPGLLVKDALLIDTMRRVYSENE